MAIFRINLKLYLLPWLAFSVALERLPGKGKGKRNLFPVHMGNMVHPVHMGNMVYMGNLLNLLGIISPLRGI